MLLEVTKPDKLGAGFAFGLLPGWWLSMIRSQAYSSHQIPTFQVPITGVNGVLAFWSRSGTKSPLETELPKPMLFSSITRMNGVRKHVLWFTQLWLVRLHLQL